MPITHIVTDQTSTQTISVSDTIFVLDAVIAFNTGPNGVIVNGGLTGTQLFIDSGAISTLNSAINFGSAITCYVGVDATLTAYAPAIQGGAPLSLINRGVIASAGSSGVASSGGATQVTNYGAISGLVGVFLGALANHTVTNYGTIHSGTLSDEAVFFSNGDDLLINDGDIVGRVALAGGIDEVFNGGTIRGSAAITVFGGDKTIQNTGSITGDISLAGGSDQVTNHGLIEGNVGFGSGTDTLFNSGTIRADTAISGGVGVKTITNAGDIFGAIALGTGDDTVTNLGFVQGSVALGDGGNTYDGSAGRVLGQVLGGVGLDLMYGGDFRDTFDGGEGSNSLVGAGGDDSLAGGGDFDSLSGGAGDDALYGNGGSDSLNGGAGADQMQGGAGLDSAMYDGARFGVRVSLADNALNIGEAAGDELIDIENLFGTRFADRLTGDGAANGLDGYDGNDLLEGGAGIDSLVGEAGSDTLNGGAGNDAMTGGAGNDIYIVDSAGDVANESIAGSSGIDLVRASRSFSLSDAIHAKGSLENLTLTGTGAFSAAGNALANTLVGNAGGNRMTGLAGLDTLTGAGGNDRFVYTAASQSRGANTDVIRDFDDRGNDRLDLSGLFGGVLTYRGLGALNGVGQVHIKDIAGSDVLVEVNLSGGIGPEMTIRLANTTAASMTASDFVL